MHLSDKAQVSLERVIAKFQAGDLSAVTAITRIQLDPAAPMHKWSLTNKVLAFGQAQELDCRGFRQWQAVGRKVKKGSKAVYILRPHTVKKEDRSEAEAELVCVGFSAVAVFAASSTEGETPLPEYAPKSLPPLHDLAERFGISVSYVPVNPRALGDCTSDGSRIRLGSHDTRVFFHELAHAIHARIDGELTGGQQVDQETVAELTCAVLMDFYGLVDHTGNAWRYISRYADDPLLAITKALRTVEKVVKELQLC